MKSISYTFLLFSCFFCITNLVAQNKVEESIKTPFFEDFNDNEINNTIWQVATWSEHGGQTGKERCFVKDGFLNMLFVNDSEEGFLSSAIQTRSEFLYGKWEARIKPSSIPGILNSFYTIDWNNTADNSSTNNGTKQEIDIEFLTYTFEESSGKVHFAVHAEDKTSFNTNPDIDLDFNPSEDFHVWGFEISPERISWFVDSLILQEYVYVENDIEIDSSYQLKLNVWSAANWINGPPSVDVESTYLIDWIRFTPLPNSPVPFSQSTSELRCKILPNPSNSSVQLIYQLEKTSTPELYIYNSTGSLVYSEALGVHIIGEHSKKIDLSKLNSGVYFVHLVSNSESFKTKLILK